MNSAFIAGTCCMLLSVAVAAEAVKVKDRREPVNLDSENFSIHQTFEGGRYIREMHYDAENQYLVYKQKSSYYQRCGVEQDVVDAWVAADSPDRFYQDRILRFYKCCDDNMPACEYD